MEPLLENKKNEGYIAILGVIIVGAIGLSVALVVIFTGIDSIKTSLVTGRSAQAKALTDACMEEALQQIRNDEDFVGDESLDLAGGECDYSVTNLGEEDREITAVGNYQSVVRKVKVNLEHINPELVITYWQEVDSF